MNEALLTRGKYSLMFRLKAFHQSYVFIYIHEALCIRLTADLIFNFFSLSTPAENHGKEDWSPEAEGGELSEKLSWFSSAKSKQIKHRDRPS